MTNLMKGKIVAEKIVHEVKIEVEKLRNNGINPKLKIIRVGDRKDDLAYEKAAIRRMSECNILCDVLSLPGDVSQETFIEQLKAVSDDESVYGILVLRPLPKQIDENKVKYFISPEKDIDCFNPINVAKILEDDESGFSPCTPLAAMEMLKYYKVELKGKEAVVIGRSMVVGKPMSILLLKEDATVTVCHSKTKNLEEITRRADILVVGIGKSKMIDSKYIKEGAIVIDVGINVDSKGNMTGDVDTEDCIRKARLITPVPEGIGSVTTSVLAKNLIKACRMRGVR